MQRHRFLAFAVVVAVSTSALVAHPQPIDAGESGVVVYVPPVDAPIVDPFRAPPTPYGAGNRGLEYATEIGTPARAVAPGEVVFAGVVARTRHVTVLHPDGLRSTVSFLHTIEVVKGQHVETGQVLGTTDSRLHFGVRADDTYVDPEALFRGASRTSIRLIPTDEAGSISVAEERRAIHAWLAAEHPTIVDSSAGWLRDRLARTGRMAEYFLPVFNPAGFVLESGFELYERLSARGPCTPENDPPPSVGSRRIVLLVGGLGSTSEEASVDDVETSVLGYDEADVYRFSYNGGRTTDPTDRNQQIPSTDYDVESSQLDIRSAGGHLEELIADLAEAEPGVPIDVVAHSQGGLVTRWALRGLAEQNAIASLGAVVTLGTPHRGADLAVALDLVGSDPSTAASFDLLSRAGGSGIESRSTSVRQLAVTSALIDDLQQEPLPGVTVTSVAARGDLIVPSTRAHLDRAQNVVVAVDGPTAHDRLPGSAAASREIALAIAGLPPTCESTADVVIDVTTGGAIAHAERLVALGALTGSLVSPG